MTPEQKEKRKVAQKSYTERAAKIRGQYKLDLDAARASRNLDAARASRNRGLLESLKQLDSDR